MNKPIAKCMWGVCLVLSLGVAAIGCGDANQTDNCDGVTCEFGTCDSETGQCVNESSCNVSGECLPGWECSVDGQCQALTKCESDGDCDTGNCSQSGACLNPETCSSNADCLPRTYCEKDVGEETGECVADPCRNVDCQRGVCKPGTTQCVSAESCTKRTEHLDCVANEKCAVPEGQETGTCRGQETFCEEKSCERGVCSFREGGCGNAKDCDGDDAKCDEGMFCDEMDRCQANLCVQRGVDCEDDGECQPSTGECENATSCESNADCLNDPDHVCVQGSCRLRSSACGDAGGEGGCPGNQICEYDAEQMTASCKEPETCVTSFDCKEGRRCNGDSCVDIGECSNDPYEPSTVDEPASLSQGPGNLISASLCANDRDVYSFDTSGKIEDGEQATLLVELDLPARERGLGSVNLTVNDPSGSEVESVSTGALGHDGQIDVSTQFDASSAGVYTIEVAPGDELAAGGLGYDVSANVVTSATIEACANPTPIETGKVSGSFSGATSTSLGSTCTSPTNPSPERIYSLEVDRPQEVTIDLTPIVSRADLTMSLRERCTQPGTERACASRWGTGTGESLTALLEEGTYYLVVQAASPDKTGPFEFTVDRVATVCGSGDNYCTGEGTSSTCTPYGGRYESIECDRGCNMTSGLCEGPRGDRCVTSGLISPDDSSVKTLYLQQSQDDYQMNTGSCLGYGLEQTNTGGGDRALRIEVPAGQAIRGEVAFDDQVEGSAYLVRSCGQTSATCQSGLIATASNDYEGTIAYGNTTEETETLYLILDTAAGEPSSAVHVDVEYMADVSCPSGYSRCTGAFSAQSCKEDGSGFAEPTACPLTCGPSGGCLEDTGCSNVPDMTNLARQPGGVSIDTVWGKFRGQLEADGCGGLDDWEVDEFEGTWSVSLNAGETLQADVTENEEGWTDEALFITSQCQYTEETCLDTTGMSDGPLSAQYTAEEAQTVYVTVEGDEDDEDSDDPFTLTMEIE